MADLSENNCSWPFAYESNGEGCRCAHYDVTGYNTCKTGLKCITSDGPYGSMDYCRATDLLTTIIETEKQVLDEELEEKDSQDNSQATTAEEEKQILEEL